MMILQNQFLHNYRQVNRNIFGILSLVIGIFSFGFNYIIALNTYPNTPMWATKILYYGLFLALSLAYLQLSNNVSNKLKYLVYYMGCNFYGFLIIAYILNQLFDVLVDQNKIIFTLIFTTLSCIIYYLFSQK